MSEPCLSITLLTEDSARDARATLHALVKRALLLLHPAAQTHKIRFLPAEPAEEAAMHGSFWKSTDPRDRDQQVRLLRYLARRLSQPASFVFFHVDGDRPWSQHETSENVAKFARLIVARLPQVVDRGRAQVGRVRDLAPAAPTLALHHLLLVCPFYCIEAWLYQNRRQALAICRREHDDRCYERLQAVLCESESAEQRPHPEEWERPKERLCLKSRHNRELAEVAFPAATLDDERRSFHQTMQRLRACEDLLTALQQTAR